MVLFFKAQSMTMETETIFGQVISKANNYQIGDSSSGKHIIKSQELRDYERSFFQQCTIYKNRLIAKPFRLRIDVYESSIRYDLDNALKTILDCLQYSKAITDDNLCIGIDATKHIDSRCPRIVYSIEETEPRLF